MEQNNSSLNPKSTGANPTNESTSTFNGPVVAPAGLSKAPVEETVEVSKTVLEKLLNRVDRLESDNEILKEVADKSRLERVTSLRNQGKLVKKARVNYISGKPVVGWATVKNDVYVDEQGRLHEEQIVKVIFKDETSSELSYRNFSRMRSQVEGEVIEESRDKDGNVNVVVQLADGQTFKLDTRFIN